MIKHIFPDDAEKFLNFIKLLPKQRIQNFVGYLLSGAVLHNSYVDWSEDYQNYAMNNSPYRNSGLAKEYEKLDKAFNKLDDFLAHNFVIKGNNFSLFRYPEGAQDHLNELANNKYSNGKETNQQFFDRHYAETKEELKNLAKDFWKQYIVFIEKAEQILGKNKNLQIIEKPETQKNENIKGKTEIEGLIAEIKSITQKKGEAKNQLKSIHLITNSLEPTSVIFLVLDEQFNKPIRCAVKNNKNEETYIKKLYNIAYIVNAPNKKVIYNKSLADSINNGLFRKRPIAKYMRTNKFTKPTLVQKSEDKALLVLKNEILIKTDLIKNIPSQFQSLYIDKTQ